MIASLAVALLAGCGGGGGDTTAAQLLPTGCRSVPAPPPKQVHLSRPTSELRQPATAVIVTSCGTFRIALDVTRAPKTTSSFANLVRKRVYDGTLFHRIVRAS